MANEVPGWLQSYSDNFNKAGNFLVSSAGEFARDAEKAGGMVMRLGVSGLGAAFSALISVSQLLASVFKSSISEATHWANSLATMRANNGLNFGQGYALAAQNSVFGISPERTASIYGDPGNSSFLQGQRANSMGFANPQSAGGLQQIAEQYQKIAAQGPYGRVKANARLDSLYGGKAPDEVRNIVNMRPQQIASQVAYGQSVQKSFGIDPEMLRKYAEDIPLAIDRIGFAFQQAKLKVAVQIAPFLEQTLGAVANYIGKNADKISEAIKTGVSWLIQVLPPLLLKGGAALLMGASLILKGVAWLAQGVASHGALLIQIFNALLASFKGFVKNLMGLTGGLKGPLAKVALKVGQVITGNTSNDPASNAINTGVGAAAGRYVIQKAAPAVGKWALKKMFGGAATGAAEATVTTGGELSTWGKLGSGLGKIVKFVRTAPSLGVSGEGIGAALAAAPEAVAAAGVGVGTAGYEALRRTNLPVVGGNISAYQIGKYYWSRLNGDSVDAAGLRAQGKDPEVVYKQLAAQAAKKKAAADAAATAHPVQKLVTPPPLGSVPVPSQQQGSQQQAPQQPQQPSNILTRLAQPIANSASAESKTLADLSLKVGHMADNYSADILKELQGIRSSSDGVKSAIQEKNGQPIVLGHGIVDRIGANIAEDTVRLARRR